MKKVYAGFDLHSSNSLLGVMDEEGKRLLKKRLQNDPLIILHTLKPYKEDIEGVAVESTYNWYWLVDLLVDQGYKVHLANTAAIQKYTGLKHSDDVDDAFWLCDMLRLGILPEGYIYPKEERPVRDLLRKRGHLVRLRTSLILSLQNIISRNNGCDMNVNDIKSLREDRVQPFLPENEDIRLSGTVSKEAIDFFTRKIREIEGIVEKRISLRPRYRYLQTIPGVGKILALTIMLETGPIERFSFAGDYASYCRKVPTRWTSNAKSKGKGNKKNGNKYLAWAFSEAAELAKRYDRQARALTLQSKRRPLKEANFLLFVSENEDKSD